MSTLVLMPGLDGTGNLFRPLLEVIPPRYAARVMTYPADRFIPYADLLGVVEQQLGDEDDVVLVAESFSGPLAVRYAAAHPGRVAAVVLCASFVRPPFWGWIRWFVVPPLFRAPPPGVVIRRLMVGSDAPESLVRAVRAAVARVSPAVLAGRLKEVAKVDCAGALRDARAPVLYLTGTQDALVGYSAVEAVRAARPDVRVRRVEGPHLLLQRAPAEAWREIQAFLDDLAAGASVAASEKTGRRS
jgi:pimeloyl-[acyl-carrier protein] methyl ester esterase